MPTSAILSFVFIFISSFHIVDVNAQQWFETGDVWVQREFNGLSGYQGYEEVMVEGDTIVDNQSAKILEVYNKGVSVAFGGSQIERTYKRIVREENDKVYHWDGETYVLIYDFNLVIGDTIYYSYNEEIQGSDCGDPVRYILKDTSSIVLGNHTLRVQNFEVYLDYWNEYSEHTIIEKIGLVEGHFDVSSSFACYTDATGYHLCSYSTDQDSILFLQQPCYDLPSSTNDVEIKGLKLYPNPTDGVIYIESEEVIEMSSIYGLDGRLLHRSKPTHSLINLNKYVYKPGLYLIELESRKGNVSKKRIYIK